MSSISAEETNPLGKILIVDDSKTVRSMIKETLANLGLGDYQCTEAEDGKLALEALRSGPFDLMTTDMDMPNLSGFDLCKTVLADRLLAKMPIIVISAMSNADKADFIKLGVRRIAFKPLQSAHLEAFLREIFPVRFAGK
jgi:CheY-like chemotaxis protein